MFNNFTSLSYVFMIMGSYQLYCCTIWYPDTSNLFLPIHEYWLYVCYHHKHMQCTIWYAGTLSWIWEGTDCIFVTTTNTCNVQCGIQALFHEYRKVPVLCLLQPQTYTCTCIHVTYHTDVSLPYVSFGWEIDACASLLIFNYYFIIKRNMFWYEVQC